MALVIKSGSSDIELTMEEYRNFQLMYLKEYPQIDELTPCFENFVRYHKGAYGQIQKSEILKYDDLYIFKTPEKTELCEHGYDFRYFRLVDNNVCLQLIEVATPLNEPWDIRITFDNQVITHAEIYK